MRSLTLCGLTAVLTLFATAASAVPVTARGEGAAGDVPVAVTPLSAQDLEKVGTPSVADTLAKLPPLPPDPALKPISTPTPPGSFCSEEDRVKFLTDTFNPAAEQATANSQAASAHLADLSRATSEAKAVPDIMAARAAFNAYRPKADAAYQLGQQIQTIRPTIMATPITSCHPPVEGPTPAQIATVPTTLPPTSDAPKPPTRVSLPGGAHCPMPPKPMIIGPNSRYGSGARNRAKAMSTVMGLAGGFMGGGGGSPMDGGGGGSDGPPTIRCHIKDSELTVFTDPETGVSLKVGAKRVGDMVNVFAGIGKSPDSGTFQSAALQRDDGAEDGPNNVGICDLWGEWSLTVSWTRETYVDNQLVSREEGGWAKNGTFTLPGFLTSDPGQSGLWKQLGFSNASHGARQIMTQYKLPAGDLAQHPTRMIIQVTRPGQNPVTTVPFALDMVEGPSGFTFAKADYPDCPMMPVDIADNTMAPPPLPPVASTPPDTPHTVERPGTGGPDADAQRQVANTPVEPPAASDDDDFVTTLVKNARALGIANDQVPPAAGDADTQLKWDQKLVQESDVQEHMLREFDRLQTGVAKSLNDYLAAQAGFQERFAYVSSLSTNLQGMLANWQEAKGIYEKADFAFAVANLGMGAGKLGFKAVKWFFKAPAVAETAEVAAGVARATETAAGAGEAGVDLAKTQEFNQVIAPPGAVVSVDQARQLAGRAEFINNAVRAGGKAEDAARLWEAQQQYRKALDQSIGMLEHAKKTGAPADLVRDLQQGVDELIARGPPTVPPPTALEIAQKAIDPHVAQIAQEAGVDTTKIAEGLVGKTGNAEAIAEAEWEILRQVAKAKGWHDIPQSAYQIVTNTLIQARQAAGGIKGGATAISPQLMDGLKTLKGLVEARGLNFAEWLATAGGEMGANVKQVINVNGIEVVGNTEEIMEGIGLLFDPEDISLLEKILETDGDIAKLKSLLSPTQLDSFHALLAANGAAGITTAVTGPSAPTGSSVPSAGAVKLDEQQVRNVLDQTGKVGELGLMHVTDEFGFTGSIDPNQGYIRNWARLSGKALWEFLGSPSATTAGLYYTLQAQDEVLSILQQHGPELIDLGLKLDAADRALRDLEATLNRQSLTGPDSYLGGQAPDQLRKILDDLKAIHDGASPGWKAAHDAQLQARADHINGKLKDLAETLQDLQALKNRIGQVRAWLDSVRLGPDGKPRGPVEDFNPQTYIRLASIGLYLRTMGADVFGLTSDKPFHLIAAGPTSAPHAPKPAAQPVSNTSTPPADPEAEIEKRQRQIEERAKAAEAAGDTEIDPSFDEWIDKIQREERAEARAARAKH